MRMNRIFTTLICGFPVFRSMVLRSSARVEIHYRVASLKAEVWACSGLR